MNERRSVPCAEREKCAIRYLMAIFLVRKGQTVTAICFLCSMAARSNAHYGLPKSQLDKLQRIQNVAARLVKGVRKQDHITPTLKALHWLPIEKRIIFKILLMTYKTLNGLAPSYLTTLITPYHLTRKLRSSSRSTLHVPRVKTSTYGDRAFSSAALKLWNSLPDHVKSKHTLTSFKSSLKTFFI